MSDSFKFYRLMHDTWMKLQDPMMRLQYFEAVINYWLNGILPDDPVMQALINGAVFSIDRSNEISSMRSENMIGNQNAVKNWEKVSKQKQTETNRSEQKKQSPSWSKEVWSIEDKKIEENKKIIQKTILCNWTLHDTPSFEKFWSLYPNKKDKKKARDKFGKLSLEKKQQAIDWISRLMKSDQWKKWFIPLPTTYLNGERREDEVIDKSSRINQIQEYQRQARLEEAREILYRDSNPNVNIQSETFDRRWEISSS